MSSWSLKLAHYNILGLFGFLTQEIWYYISKPYGHFFFETLLINNFQIHQGKKERRGSYCPKVYIQARYFQKKKIRPMYDIFNRTRSLNGKFTVGFLVFLKAETLQF